MCVCVCPLCVCLCAPARVCLRALCARVAILCAAVRHAVSGRGVYRPTHVLDLDGLEHVLGKLLLQLRREGKAWRGV